MIRGGTVVTATEVMRADVGIRGERIAAVGEALAGRQTIDAHGRGQAVREGDFIRMGSYRPQLFHPKGWEPSAYLLQKDVNRDVVF